MGKVDTKLEEVITGGSMESGFSLCGIVDWDGFGKWASAVSISVICVLKRLASVRTSKFVWGMRRNNRRICGRRCVKEIWLRCGVGCGCCCGFLAGV